MSKEEDQEQKERTKKYKSNDLIENKLDTIALTEILGDIVQNIIVENEQIKTDNQSFLTLIHKAIYHSISICKLTEGVSLKSEKFDYKEVIIDISSINVLTRTVLETLLTFEYLHISNITKEWKEFRFDLWRASAYTSMQNYNLSKETEEFKAYKENNRKNLETLISKIKSNPLFEKLRPDQKKNIENKGVARILNWFDMIKSSQLKTEYFTVIYRDLSQYAHSEYFSLIHLGTVDLNISNEKTIHSANFALRILNQMISVIILMLMKQFDSALKLYNSLPQTDKNTIIMWSQVATDRKDI